MVKRTLSVEKEAILSREQILKVESTRQKAKKAKIGI